ncbi:MAG: transcription-repair coupling factor, partial [Ketobacter sp.]
MPLFFESTATLFDYLPDDTLLMTAENLQDSAEHFWNDCLSRYEDLRYDRMRPILPPQDLFIAVDEMNRALKLRPRIAMRSGVGDDKPHHSTLPLSKPPELPVDAKATNPLMHVESYCLMAREDNKRVLFIAESAGRRDSLLELLKRIRIQPKAAESWTEFLTETSAPHMIGIAD